MQVQQSAAASGRGRVGRRGTDKCKASNLLLLQGGVEVGRRGTDKCKASNLPLLQGGVEGESWEEGY